MMTDPYRTAAAMAAEQPPEHDSIIRSGQWLAVIDGLKLEWDEGSGFMTLRVHDKSGCAEQKIHIKTAQAKRLMSALATAITEAGP